MILLMVDTFQFVTALGLDVIEYCLLLSLGGGDNGKNWTNRVRLHYFLNVILVHLTVHLFDGIRIVAIGLNTEQWLTSLETFTARTSLSHYAAFKRGTRNGTWCS
jgi:hypothetical protein